MRPIRVNLEGFRSFRAPQTIDFSDLGLFAIIGDTGAGKSSILEAMVYALYNKSTFDERTVKSLIALDADTMRVDFTFAVGDAQYVVTRSASRIAGRPAIHSLRSLGDTEARFHNDTTVSNEIVRLTKLTYATFTKTIVLPQGRFAELLTASGSEREPVLTVLFSLDEVDRLRESLARPIQQARERCVGLRAELAAYGDNPEAAFAAEVVHLKDAEALRNRLADAWSGCSARMREQEADAKKKERLAGAQRRIDDLDIGAQRIESLEGRHAALREQLDIKAAECKTAADKRADAAAAVAHMHSVGRDAESLQKVRDALRLIAELGTQCDADGLLIEREEASLRDQESKLAASAKQEADTTAELAVREDVARSTEMQYVSAAERRDEASAKWIALLLARNRLNEARTVNDQIENDLPKSRAAVEQAHAEMCAADGAVEAALAGLELAQIANLAATVGASVHPGNFCPVCAQVVPEGYARPNSVDIENAREKESAARRDQTKKHAACAALAERVAQLLRNMEVSRDALVAALEEEEATRNAATAAGVNVDAPTENAAIALFTREWESAKKARDTAARHVTEVAKKLAGNKASTEALKAFVESDRERLQRRREAIFEYRTRIEAERLSIRDEFRPAAPASIAIVEECVVRVDEALASAKEAQVRANEAELIFQTADRFVREAEQRLAVEITAVIDANIAVCDEAVRVLRGLDKEIALDPEPIRVKSDVESAILWASSIRAWCAVSVDAICARIRDADERIALKQTELDALLEGVSAETGSALEPMLQKARTDAAVLADRVEMARVNVEKSERASRRLASVEPLLSGLAALSFHLESNRFKKYLTGLREQSLLGAATDVLRKMSDGRFAFAPGFQILDNQTQLPRDAKTLSGGEKFLASLALALGLVEMTSRAGGRLDALFLDEGFGSLDATALDAALLELKERAESGKLIGVITHVRGIAAEIDDVIRVQRLQSGSIATKLTPSDRDRMMDETLVSGLLEATR